jgi:hypothetical protein
MARQVLMPGGTEGCKRISWQSAGASMLVAAMCLASVGNTAAAAPPAFRMAHRGVLARRAGIAPALRGGGGESEPVGENLFKQASRCVNPPPGIPRTCVSTAYIRMGCPWKVGVGGRPPPP